VVRASGLTESQFEAELQSGLLIDQLRNAVIESAFVAPYELDRRYAMEKQGARDRLRADCSVLLRSHHYDHR
jgi:hypothetical protein